MSIEIKVPVLPESVADATIAKWHKKPGDSVKRDETIVDIETDKVMLEVPAPEEGVLGEILEAEGTTVTANQIIGILNKGAAEGTQAKTAQSEEKSASGVNGSGAQAAQETKETAAAHLSPSVRRVVAEHDIDISKVKGTGKDGRVTKEDVEKYVAANKTAKAEPAAAEMPAMAGARTEQRVPMTRLRQRIAERLLNAQQQMAILTTFNEVNMQAVMNLRSQYKDQFEKTHKVRLGFMSFFVKAAVAALKKFPDVNAYIDGNDMVYHGYCDVGVAVSTDRGLVVPVLRDAENMSMAEIEAKIAEYADKARNNKLTIDEMSGGTFSITNGGVFGSLLSTPIVNPPQSGILGMHKIEERPVVEKGQIVIRPMMYLALSYDHRIIDGRVSVQFLRTIKELLEDPARLLLDV